MIRYLGSAVAALLTLFVILFGLSKAIEPATSGLLAIIGKLELAGPAPSQAPDDASWCQREPNRTIELAESYRELCDATRDDCGPECQRVPTSTWSADCSTRSAISVCIPRNPLLGGGGSSG